MRLDLLPMKELLLLAIISCFPSDVVAVEPQQVHLECGVSEVKKESDSHKGEKGEKKRNKIKRKYRASKIEKKS